MALSNIFREPRREITEQATGLIVIILVIAPFYFPVKWLADSCTDCGTYSVAIAVSIIVVLFGTFIAGFFLVVGSLLVHALGEYTCNRLQDIGIQLRPRRGSHR